MSNTPPPATPPLPATDGAKSALFQARTSPSLHAACQQKLARLGTTQSRVINMLMKDWLQSSSPDKMPVDPSRLVGKPRKRKDIWLNSALLDAVEKRAAADGLPVATWIASLIQSALMADPVILDKEMMALEQQVREISALGRNLNQIAHHLNSGTLKGHPADVLAARMDMLRDIQSGIEQLRSRSNALIRARRKAWGIE